MNYRIVVIYILIGALFLFTLLLSHYYMQREIDNVRREIEIKSSSNIRDEIIDLIKNDSEVRDSISTEKSSDGINSLEFNIAEKNVEKVIKEEKKLDEDKVVSIINDYIQNRPQDIIKSLKDYYRQQRQEKIASNNQKIPSLSKKLYSNSLPRVDVAKATQKISGDLLKNNIDNKKDNKENRPQGITEKELSILDKRSVIVSFLDPQSAESRASFLEQLKMIENGQPYQEAVQHWIPVLGQNSVLISKFLITVYMAEPGLYHKFTYSLFNLEEKMPKNADELLSLAEKNGLNRKNIEKIIQDEKKSQKISAMLSESLSLFKELGGDNTPFNIVGGKILGNDLQKLNAVDEDKSNNKNNNHSENNHQNKVDDLNNKNNKIEKEKIENPKLKNGQNKQNSMSSTLETTSGEKIIDENSPNSFDKPYPDPINTTKKNIKEEITAKNIKVEQNKQENNPLMQNRPHINLPKSSVEENISKKIIIDEKTTPPSLPDKTLQLKDLPPITLDPSKNNLEQLPSQEERKALITDNNPVNNLESNLENLTLSPPKAENNQERLELDIDESSEKKKKENNDEQMSIPAPPPLSLESID